jgi:hypothetical protein
MTIIASLPMLLSFTTISTFNMHHLLCNHDQPNVWKLTNVQPSLPIFLFNGIQMTERLNADQYNCRAVIRSIVDGMRRIANQVPIPKFNFSTIQGENYCITVATFFIQNFICAAAQ